MSDVVDLVQNDRVHSRLYTDEDVFRLELEKIWYAGWVYLGHESEIPDPGMYRRKRVALQELLFSRDRDGVVRVFYNRCPHRANMLCRDEDGDGSSFRCDYHGWTFNSDGSIHGIPFRESYGDELNEVTARLGMSQVPFVDSYQGFVFCSLNEPAQTFAEYIEPVRFAFDRLTGLSPDGEVQLTAGWLKHRTRCNWKVAVENEVDGYHVRFVHRSLYRATHTSRKAPAGLRALGQGHTEVDFGTLRAAEGVPLTWLGGTDPARLPNYLAAMHAAYGEEATDERLVRGPAHVMVFPNLFLAQLNIVVINPLSPNEHVQESMPVALRGGCEINKRILRRTEGALGPAGMFLADDAEIMERNQLGFAAHQPEWLELSRGLATEEVEGEQIWTTDDTSEMTQRSIYRRYVEMMTAGPRER